MSNEREHVERTTIRETPDVVVTRSSNAGWWIAAIVAVIAVVGLIFVFTSQNRQQELQAARDQGAAQASLDAATANAQRAALQASQSAQAAMDTTARASQRAAEAAQTAANDSARQAQQSASAAADAAHDATNTAPDR